MLLKVLEQDNVVHIDVSGVAGRQHTVLKALAFCRGNLCECDEPHRDLGQAAVSVRSRRNNMHIELKANDTAPLDALAVYRCLKRVLIEQPAATAPAPAAAPDAAAVPA